MSQPRERFCNCTKKISEFSDNIEENFETDLIKLCGMILKQFGRNIEKKQQVNYAQVTYKKFFKKFDKSLNDTSQNFEINLKK